MAQLNLLKAIYVIVCTLEQMSAPEASRESDAQHVRAIAEQTEAVRQLVVEAGRATSLGGGPARGSGKATVWSGIDAPFLPAEPFLQR